MKQIILNKSRVEIVGENSHSVLLGKVNARGRESKHDAFFVGDLGDIVNKYNKWVEMLPRVEPFYAVKCNDDPAILALLANLGTGFDCASKAEIQKVRELNVDSSRIIYANPCKQSSFIQYAAKHNIQLMTFDNETELHKVKALHPNAKMVIRILPPVTDKCIAPLGMKFGCQLKEVSHLLKVARDISVDIVGVSFHVGSGCYDEEAFAAAVMSARAAFDIGLELGFDLKLLDIGGGFPGQSSAKVSFEEIVAVLRPALDTFFPESMGVRIIAEPGRFFVASAFTLAVNIIAKREVIVENNNASPDDTEVGRNETESMFMYYVNDGVYGSFNCILFDHMPVVASLLEEDKMACAVRYKCSIWGPTCDGLDCIVKECEMPELSTGDWIVFRDMGAYTMSAATCFNGMPKPKCYYIIDENNQSLLSSINTEPVVNKKKKKKSNNKNRCLTTNNIEMIAATVYE
jgi:ornithine decarboxylase